MTILLSALTRYHVFDLALQLQRRGVLERVVSAYPAFALGQFAALAPSLHSLGRFAAARKGALSMERVLGPAACSPLHHLVYRRFARAVAAVARRSPARVVYGLSGYMLEVLEQERPRAQLAVVDHGSLHIGTERAILDAECARFGFRPFGNWQYDWLVRRMEREFALADRVVCCSELARTSMIEHGVPAPKIAVHRLGVDLRAFTPRPAGAARKGPLRLLFVGAITPLKGVHYLLEAFRQLDGDTELWLVGAAATDPVLQELLAACSAATGRVRLIGPVAQASLRDIYHQCDLFVLPSLSDGWAMVVSQALACALPVVVSDMTGAKELVVHGVNGYVTRSGDAADLADKLALALARCRAGGWDRGAAGAPGSVMELSWDDYGNGWMRWLRQLGV